MAAVFGRRASAGYFYALFCAAFVWACATAFSPARVAAMAGPAWRRDPEAILAISRAARRAEELSGAISRVLVEHGVGRGDVRFESVAVPEPVDPLRPGAPLFPHTEMAVDLARDAAPIVQALESAVRTLEGATVKREPHAEHERIAFRLDGVEVVAIDVYPMRLPAGSGGPRIAIVIDDVGYSSEPIYRLLGATQGITFAVLPYGPHAKELAEEIHAQGAEVMLHLPMQPEGEPGGFSKEGMLLESMDGPQLRALVAAGIGKVPHVSGVNNHMGSVLTARADPMRVVMDELAGRNLFFLDSRTTPKTVAYRLAREAGVPAAERDVFLDDIAEKKAIVAQLGRLETLARQHGSAIAIGHPYPETVEALLEWLPGMPDKGLELVPASRLSGLSAAPKSRKRAEHVVPK